MPDLPFYGITDLRDASGVSQILLTLGIGLGQRPA